MDLKDRCIIAGSLADVRVSAAAALKISRALFADISLWNHQEKLTPLVTLLAEHVAQLDALSEQLEPHLKPSDE